MRSNITNALPILLYLAGSEYHNHLPPFQLRLKLDFGDSASLLFYLHQELHTQLLMCHLPAPETQRNLDLVALLEKLFHRTHLNLVIMRVDIRAKLDFLDLDGLLLFAGFRSLLLGLEFIFSEIHDLADRDFGIYRDFHKIETGFLGPGKRVALGNGPMVLSGLVDELNIAGYYCFINARTFFNGCAAYWAAYVTLLSLLASRAQDRGRSGTHDMI